MSFDINDLDELAGSPKESLRESSGPSAERKFLVPMNERLTFAENIYGIKYPHFPHCRVVGIDLQPWTEDLIPEGTIVDPSISSADYGEQPCLATVKYGPDFTEKDWPSDMPKPPLRANTELRYNVKASGKFLLIPASAMRWEDDATVPVPEDANSVIMVRMASISLQWDFVDDPPMGDLSDLIGRINSNPFLGNDAETILFESFDISETFRDSPLNPHTNRVNVDLLVRSIDTGSGVVGWNHDYREAPAGWFRMLLSDGQPRYKTADFSGMFL